MDFTIIRKKKNIDNIYRQKLRVAAYVRVSTKLELQLYSFESQLKYYENVINRNANWTLVGLYSDYGISGTSKTKRIEFLRMIEDAYDGKIDYIITKSISRFARNTYDALEIIRELRKRNIGVYFEEEHLDTLKLESELLLTILCSVAQQESENYSNHIHTGKIMKMKQGRIVTSHEIYGYKLVKKDGISTFKIKKRESLIVKEIYKMYIDGYSYVQIAEELNKRKVRYGYGKNQWNRHNISSIIKNEAYVGKLVQQKKYVTMINGERKYRLNKGERNLYVVNNHHPAIIDEEIYEKAKSIRENKTFERNYNGEALGVPVICGFCGNHMGCNNRKTYNWQYICSRKKNFSEECPNASYVRMDFLQNGFLECMKKLSRYMYRKKITENFNYLNNQIRKVKSKKEILLSYNIELLNNYMDKKINPYDYKVQKNDLEKRIKKFQNEIERLEIRLDYYRDSNSDLESIFFVIDNEIKDFDKFDLEVFRKLVSFVIVGGYSEKGTKLPYVFRYVYSSKKSLRKDYREKINNNPLKDDSYIKLLDFKSDFQIKFYDDDKKVRTRKGNRIIFEIER